MANRPFNKNLDKFEDMKKRGIKWIFNEDVCNYFGLPYYQQLKKLDILPLGLKFS